MKQNFDLNKVMKLIRSLSASIFTTRGPSTVNLAPWNQSSYTTTSHSLWESRSGKKTSHSLYGDVWFAARIVISD